MKHRYRILIAALALLLPGAPSAPFAADEPTPALIEHCDHCHGSPPATRNAELSWYAPNLAGQHYAYLVRQLERFSPGADRDETRRHAIMERHARVLEEDEIDRIARYYADQTCARDASDLGPGLANRCAECHGVHGISDDPRVPNLAGQKVDYMINQLKSFRNAARGQRGENLGTHRASPIMGEVVEGITAEELNALTYYSSLQCR